jgi:outer membrane protein assembly factor BamB
MKGPTSSCVFQKSMELRALLVSLVVLLLPACGGGSSQNSNSNSSVTLSVSPQTLSVTASKIDSAPTASFQVSETGLKQSQSLYLFAEYSTHGISEIPPSPDNVFPVTITIQFQSPGTLGIGTYNDTVQIKACIDQACSQPVGNIPSLQTQYKVTRPVLALNSISPTSVSVGGPSFMLTILGSGFSATSTALWNGVAQNTTYVSSTELVAQIPANEISTIGTASVTINEPNDSPTTSNAQSIAIVRTDIDAVTFQINTAHTGAVMFASVTLPSNPTWSVDVGGMPSYAVIAQGKVIVTVTKAGGNSELLALDQATGTTVWGPIAINGLSNASYDNGRVFVLGVPIVGSASLDAFDINTGALDWSTSILETYDGTGAPTAADGTVYVGTFDGGTLIAIDESNGNTLWQQGVLGGFNSSPAVSADGVYVSYPCQTYDFRPATGELIWHNDAGCNGGGGATPVVANQLVYSPDTSSDYSGDVYNAANGVDIGTYLADSPPAFTTTMGYFLQSGTLRGILLSNNTVQWSFTGDGQLIGAPIVVNQYVFIGSRSGNLYALDGTTGGQVWNINLGAAIGTGVDSIPFSGLAAGDGLLVVPAGTILTAYTLSTNP